MQLVGGRTVRIFNVLRLFILTSVSRGAVQRGLDGNRIESRIARRHYGVQVSEIYSPAQHGDQAKIWCELEETYHVPNQMLWYIPKVPATPRAHYITSC